MIRRAVAVSVAVIGLVLGQLATAQATTTEKHVKRGTYSGQAGDMTTDNAIFFRVHGKGTHKTIRDLLFRNQCLTNSEQNPPHITISKAGRFHHAWTGHSTDNYAASLKGRFTKPKIAKGTLKINDNSCKSTFDFKAKHPCSTTKVKYKCPYGVKP